MLALVVGRAAPIDAVALDRDLPGVAVIAPAPGLPADHVAMAIGQDGRQFGVLDAGRSEVGAAAQIRLIMQQSLAAQILQRRRDLLHQIAAQLGLALRLLAFRGYRDATGERVQEGAAVKMMKGGIERGGAGHGRILEANR